VAAAGAAAGAALGAIGVIPLDGSVCSGASAGTLEAADGAVGVFTGIMTFTGVVGPGYGRI
jgi:hypothetical protein